MHNLRCVSLKKYGIILLQYHIVRLIWHLSISNISKYIITVWFWLINSSEIFETSGHNNHYYDVDTET
jgi:glycyl-tRNA synthetase (class II)